ncbi:MAG: hypothetical protein U5L96_04095 [Owenweeksia sp.]|nr:hypothetical protein [Owenweeksia sp.]
MVKKEANLSDDFLRFCHFSQLLPGAITGFLSLLEKTLTLTGWRKRLYIGDKLNQLEDSCSIHMGDKDVFEKPESGRRKAKSIRDFKFEVVEMQGTVHG